MDFTGATACIWGAGTVITMLVLMWMEAYDRELGHERWYTPMTPLERVCTCILWPLAAVVIPGIVVVARISLWLRPARVALVRAIEWPGRKLARRTIAARDVDELAAELLEREEAKQ